MESTAVFTVLLPWGPLLLVYAAGIIVSLVTIGTHRKVSAFALTGFVGLLLSALIRAATTLMLLPQYRGNTPIQQFAIWLSITGLIATLLTVAAMVFLIVAIFIDRRKDRLTDIF